jgi:hypothetical protein
MRGDAVGNWTTAFPISVKTLLVSIARPDLGSRNVGASPMSNSTPATDPIHATEPPNTGRVLVSAISNNEPPTNGVNNQSAAAGDGVAAMTITMRLPM